MDGEVYKKRVKPTIIIIKSSVAKQQREIEACEFRDSWIEIEREYVHLDYYQNLIKNPV